MPVDESGALDAQVQREYDSFDRKQIRAGDFLQLMTWQENNAGYPSVISLVEELLQDESAGKTEPISDYTRHTLKALMMFIRDDFSGYDYERINIQNGLYPKSVQAIFLKRQADLLGQRVA